MSVRYAWETDDPEWDDTARALWILENDWSFDKVKFVYERVNTTIYKRPMVDSLTPPWWHVERIEIPEYATESWGTFG